MYALDICEVVKKTQLLGDNHIQLARNILVSIEHFL